MDQLLTFLSFVAVLIAWIIFSTRYQDTKPRYHSFFINSLFIAGIWFASLHDTNNTMSTWTAPWSLALNFSTLGLYHQDPFPISLSK